MQFGHRSRGIGAGSRRDALQQFTAALWSERHSAQIKLAAFQPGQSAG
jgi:hypothetical protein